MWNQLHYTIFCLSFASHLCIFSWNAGGGLWAIYPIIFSISSFCGIFHSIVTMTLSIATISSFSLAAFQCAGMPPNIQWGSYPVVQKGELENYTFCHYCSKPKSPRTHHCISCGICILDMDHHCPFVSVSYLFSLLISLVIHQLHVMIAIWIILLVSDKTSLNYAKGTSRHLRGYKRVIYLEVVKDTKNIY